MEGVAKFKYDKEQDDELSLNVGDIITNIKKIEEGWCEGTLKDTNIRGMFPENFVEIKASPKVEISQPAVLRDDSKESNRKLRRAKVAFSYSAENDDELSLSLGEIVVILGDDEEGWWRGKVNGKEGVFPCNFVEPIEEEEEEPPPYSNMSVGKPAEKVRPPSMIAMPGLGGINPLELKQKLKPVGGSSNAPQINETPPQIKTNSPTQATKGTQVQKAKVMFSYNAEQEDEITIKEGDIVEILKMNTEDGWWKIRLGNKEGFVPDNFLSVLPSATTTTSQPVADIKPTSSLDNPPLPPKTSSGPSPIPSTKPKPSPSDSNLPKLPGKSPVELPKLPPKQPETPEKKDGTELDIPRQDILNNDKVKEKPKRTVRPPTRNTSTNDVPEESEKDVNKPQAVSKAPWQEELHKRKPKPAQPIPTPSTPPVAKPTPPKPASKPFKPSKPEVNTPPPTVTAVPPKPLPGTRVLPTSTEEIEKTPTIKPKVEEVKSSETAVSPDAGAWKEAFELLQAEFKQFQDKLRQEMQEEIRILAQDLDEERKKTAAMQIDIDRLKKSRDYRDNI